MDLGSQAANTLLLRQRLPTFLLLLNGCCGSGRHGGLDGLRSDFGRGRCVVEERLELGTEDVLLEVCPLGLHLHTQVLEARARGCIRT